MGNCKLARGFGATNLDQLPESLDTGWITLVGTGGADQPRNLKAPMEHWIRVAPGVTYRLFVQILGIEGTGDEWMPELTLMLRTAISPTGPWLTVGGDNGDMTEEEVVDVTISPFESDNPLLNLMNWELSMPQTGGVPEPWGICFRLKVAPVSQFTSSTLAQTSRAVSNNLTSTLGSNLSRATSTQIAQLQKLLETASRTKR